jgi:anthranilate phosphoribosyltransferase
VDEVSVAAPTHVIEIHDGARSRRQIDPEHFGVTRTSSDALVGGSAAENAAAIENLLHGERGPRRDVVLMNAAVALTAAGIAVSFKDGFRLAAEAVDRGRAAETLDAARSASR